MRELRIGQNDAGQRLDKFLTKALPSLPASLLYKSIRLKKIKRNRKRAQPQEVLAEGDVLQLFLAEEFFPDAPGAGPDLARVRVGLRVVYEDANILLLNKPAGVNVHEDDRGDGNTLLLHLQAYLFQKGEYDPAAENAFAPALCNRIDRNTCGLVIAAKNAAALREMNQRIRARTVEKYYLCAVHGRPVPPEAVLEGYLCKDETTKTVRVYDSHPPRGAKPIRTGYRTLCTEGELSLLQVRLYTGRTHQIRAHLAHIGHPLLGDGKYGKNAADRARGYDAQALCAYRVVFGPGEAGALSYLDGKEVRLHEEDIPFLGAFPHRPSLV